MVFLIEVMVCAGTRGVKPDLDPANRLIRVRREKKALGGKGKKLALGLGWIELAP